MNIFLSTPISCFEDKNELSNYKQSIKLLLKELKKEHDVCSEIESIYEESDYDTPEKSIVTDLEAVKKCDFFVFHYPKKVSTSALIELGFAIACNKTIIIITPTISTLPYLAIGIRAQCPNSQIIQSKTLDHECIKKILIAVR